MNILISWAWIAGLTCAYRLEQFGFSPVVVEKAEELRDEGYMIDFMGEGLQISQAMGIFPKLESLSENFKGIEFLNDNGKKVWGLHIPALRAYLNTRGYEYISVTRGDLERSLYKALGDQGMIRFWDVITVLDQQTDGVAVTFASGISETYDIVIGADGIHSSTRHKVRWDEKQFLVPFSSTLLITRITWAGTIQDYHYHAKSHLSPGKMFLAIPTRSEDLLVIAGIVTDESISSIRSNPIKFLQEQCGRHSLGKTVTDSLTGDEFVFVDDVAQIHMDSWTQDRVALIWDAASCPTLLSGQGAHMAMTQAYVLAHQLFLHPTDHTAAFAGYEDTLMALVTERMKRAKKLQWTIIPESRLATKLSYLIFKLMKYKRMIRLSFNQFTTKTLFDQGYPLVQGK